MRLHADNGNRVGRTAELEPVFLRKQAELRVLTFHELTEVRLHKVKESCGFISAGDPVGSGYDMYFHSFPCVSC